MPPLTHIKRIIRKSPLGYQAYNLNLRILTHLHDSNTPWMRLVRAGIRKGDVRRILSRPLPPVIHVETTNTCNGGCLMCPQVSMKRPKMVIDDSLYEKIVDECALYASIIKDFWTFMVGEPLMDKGLARRIAYAKEKRIRHIGIFTNGSLFNDKVSLEIIRSGIDHVTFSIDSADKERFAHLRPGLNLDQITENLTQFIQLRDRLGSGRPFVAIEYVETEENVQETQDFVRYWERVVDAVYISSWVNWGNDQGIMGPSRGYYYRIRRPCYHIFNDMVINVDGRVSLCCYDYEVTNVMGNVSKQKLSEIWRGERFEHIRDLHLKGRWDDIPMCASCNTWTSPSEPWWF